MCFELLLNLSSNGIRKYSFAGPKLNINELRCYKFAFECFFSDKFGLKMVICCILQIFLNTAWNKIYSFLFFIVFKVQINYFLHNFVDYFITYFAKVWNLYWVSLLIIFIHFVDVFRKPLAFLRLLFNHYFRAVF